MRQQKLNFGLNSRPAKASDPSPSFLGGSNGKKSTCNAGDPDLILGSGRSPGEGNDNPFQYSCLEKSMDRGTWWAIVHRVAKSQR